MTFSSPTENLQNEHRNIKYEVPHVVLQWWERANGGSDSFTKDYRQYSHHTAIEQISKLGRAGGWRFASS